QALDVLDQLGDAAGAVEEAVVRVAVQMNERPVRHRRSGKRGERRMSVVARSPDRATATTAGLPSLKGRRPAVGPGAWSGDPAPTNGLSSPVFSYSIQPAGESNSPGSRVRRRPGGSAPATSARPARAASRRRRG